MTPGHGKGLLLAGRPTPATPGSERWLQRFESGDVAWIDLVEPAAAGDQSGEASVVGVVAVGVANRSRAVVGMLVSTSSVRPEWKRTRQQGSA